MAKRRKGSLQKRRNYQGYERYLDIRAKKPHNPYIDNLINTFVITRSKKVGSSDVRSGTTKTPFPVSKGLISRRKKIKKKVLSNLTLLNRFFCNKKKAKARHDYFGFKSTGRKSKGGSGGRFTKKC